MAIGSDMTSSDMPSMQQKSYLHRDSINGRALTIAVNQPITAIESHGWTQATRLRRFMRAHGATYLLVQKDLAWCTERPALIVGAQCLDWQLPDSHTLICWPLDQAVFFASLSSEGFNMIDAESEMICAGDQALEVLAQTSSPLLILAGGNLAAKLEAAGYPPHAKEDQVLLDLPRFRSRSSFVSFTQLRLPHPGHLLLLGLLLGAGLLLQQLLQEQPRLEETILPVMGPVQGSPRLTAELRALRAAIQDLMPFTLHGLSHLSYDSDRGELRAKGNLHVDNLIRINEIARGLNKTLEVTTRHWQLTYPLATPEPRSQALSGIDSELARLVQPGRAAGFSVSMTNYRTGGVPFLPQVSPNKSLRLLGQDYIEAELLLTADALRSLDALAQLLSRLATYKPLLNARLHDASLELSSSGDMSLSLSIRVRGSRYQTSAHEERVPEGRVSDERVPEGRVSDERAAQEVAL